MLRFSNKQPSRSNSETCYLTLQWLSRCKVCWTSHTNIFFSHHHSLQTWSIEHNVAPSGHSLGCVRIVDGQIVMGYQCNSSVDFIPWQNGLSFGR